MKQKSTVVDTAIFGVLLVGAVAFVGFQLACIKGGKSVCLL